MLNKGSFLALKNFLNVMCRRCNLLFPMNLFKSSSYTLKFWFHLLVSLQSHDYDDLRAGSKGGDVGCILLLFKLLNTKLKDYEPVIKIWGFLSAQNCSHLWYWCFMKYETYKNRLAIHLMLDDILSREL